MQSDNAKPKATVMQITCCGCGKHMGTKDGGGQTGTTSTICESCALMLLPPHLHGEYLRRRELTEMAAMGRVWEVA